jgi:GNAT superfamily N-acetyltransferase
MSTTLRQLRPEDEEFLRDLYASTRQEEKTLLGWDEAEWQAFVAMQFTAQQRSYGMHFPDADFRLVLLDERPIGRLAVDRREDEIRVVDIALLPDCRGAGIGGRLVRDLLAEAAAVGIPVRCHVKRHSRELRFWERLGFAVVGDGPVHIFMEWTPDTTGAAVPSAQPGS